MFKSLSTSLIARGILAAVVGIIALAWPSVTVLALVIVFAVYAFVAAGLQAAQTFSSRQAGPVPGHLLLGDRPGGHAPGQVLRPRRVRLAATRLNPTPGPVRRQQPRQRP